MQRRNIFAVAMLALAAISCASGARPGSGDEDQLLRLHEGNVSNFKPDPDEGIQ